MRRLTPEERRELDRRVREARIRAGHRSWHDFYVIARASGTGRFWCGALASYAYFLQTIRLD